MNGTHFCWFSTACNGKTSLVPPVGLLSVLAEPICITPYKWAQSDTTDKTIAVMLSGSLKLITINQSMYLNMLHI